MSDPAHESTKTSRSQPQEASLEDLVAALGRPRPHADDFEDDEDEDEPPAADDEPAQARTDADDDEGPDPFAEYADLDLATSIPIDPDDNLSKVEGEASGRLMSIIESLLFAADKPMTVKQLRRLLKEPTKRQIQLALKQLIIDSQARGVVLGQVAGGFRLRTHPDNAQFVQKMLAGKPVRLSRSQLESLAVVAYRQPVTKAELDHIRGVDCGAVLRVLLERDLVKIVGRKEEPGRPHLYGTTIAFLEFFNLKGLRDLPDLQEFKELSEESEATLRHSMPGSLADEQEAMGQSRLAFPDDEEATHAEAPEHVVQTEAEGSAVLDGDEEGGVRQDAGPTTEAPPPAAVETAQGEALHAGEVAQEPEAEEAPQSAAPAEPEAEAPREPETPAEPEPPQEAAEPEPPQEAAEPEPPQDAEDESAPEENR